MRKICSDNRDHFTPALETTMRQSMDQLAAGQQQMTGDIAKLQAADQEILDKDLSTSTAASRCPGAQARAADGAAIVAGTAGTLTARLGRGITSKRRTTNGLVVRTGTYDRCAIELNGDDLRRAPIEKRKAALAKILSRAAPRIPFDEHIEEDGATVFEHACKLGLKASCQSVRARPTASAGRRIGSRARTRSRQRSGAKLMRIGGARMIWERARIVRRTATTLA
jgi:hypothetical protein